MPIDERFSAAEQPPNPLAVRTVAELSRQLRRLRLHAPRPRPTDDPLTLRALALMTELPVSTLSNAESGRILPRTEVVYLVAQACGVPPEDLPLWTQARHRAAENRVRPAQSGTRMKIRDGQVVSAVEKASIVEELPPIAAASYLDALSAQAAAECLTTIGRQAAADRLSVMSLSSAAQCLALMAPAVAVELLKTEKLTVAVEHLQEMPPHACRSLLAAIPAHEATEWLGYLSRNVAFNLAAEMPLAWKAALLTTTSLPTALAAELLFTGRYEWAIAVLCDMPPGRAANILTTLPADPALGMLTGLPQQHAAQVITAMSPARAAAILVESDDTDLKQLLDEMPAAVAATVLAELPAQRAAIYLALCKPRRSAQLLNLTLPRRAETLRQLLAPPSDIIYLAHSRPPTKRSGASSASRRNGIHPSVRTRNAATSSATP